MATNPVKMIIKFFAGILWIYSYVTLGVLMAIAAVPGYFLARWGWGLDITWASGTWTTIFDVGVGLYFSILGFFVFGLSLMIVLPIVKTVFLIRPFVGEIPLYSFRILPWYNYNSMLFLFNTVFGRFARATTVYPWYLRFMGAKIGKEVVFNTQHVYDLDIIKVGRGTVIGANASILGHVGEKGKLVRQPITIGRNCTVGQFSTIFPGVTMGDNCHVGAMSLVPKGATLDSNAIYGGVPVKKVRDLEPGVRPDTDDVPATVGGRK